MHVQKYCNIRGYEIWFVITHNNIVDSHITNTIIDIMDISQYLQDMQKKKKKKMELNQKKE